MRVTRRRAFIVFGKVTYEVLTNAESRGNNVRVVIDGDSGAVLEAAWLLR